jgi:hypothetical protein
MLKRLLASVAAMTHSFLPDSVSAKLGAETKVRMRHVDVICAPEGYPRRIEWDLDDSESVAKAKVQIEALRRSSVNRSFYPEIAPGEIGHRMKEPDIQQDMISLPHIYAG